MRADRERSSPGLYHAALYMRLSRDDDGAAESASIAVQRKMLRAYAGENGYSIAGEYIDDGWSGTNFDRPDFKRMLADIEAGKVNMVITKDFSRLGRDYITAGQYTELYFPERNVRYIAVNDGYDSANPCNDIAPFKHVVNEMYARDASRKIRSAFRTKMREGSYIGNFAPYGYRKDPVNKNHLIVDREAAAVVWEIFKMAADGARPSEIAAQLNRCAVAPPAVYRCLVHSHLNPDRYTLRREWTSSTICKILSNIVYLGHMAQGKTSRPSFKSKTSFRKPQEEWQIVENTHEPLVARAVFDLARKRSVSRRKSPKTDFCNVFSGVAKCADCGGNMSITGSRKKGSPYNLVCGRYKLYGSKECSNHFIDYTLLYQSVLLEVRGMLALSEREQSQVLDEMEKSKWNKETDAAKDEHAARAKTLESRSRALDGLIQRMYEDNATGKLNDERFAKLCSACEEEQRGIEERLAQLKKRGACEAGVQASRRDFLKLLDGLAGLQELTPELVKRLIDRIEIEQGSYEQTPEGKKKHQTARIFWCFTGEKTGGID